MNIFINPIGGIQTPIIDWTLAEAINSEGLKREKILKKFKREDLKTEIQKNIYDMLISNEFSYPYLLKKNGRETCVYAMHIINILDSQVIKNKYDKED